jgi:hypothetical protein
METSRPDDLEKSSVATGQLVSSTVSAEFADYPPLTFLQRMEKWENHFGVEGRGIERVPPDARPASSSSDIIQIGIAWVSINLVASNTVVGILGPQLFDLSFKDSALICLFANIAATLGPSYIAGLGPKSGNRTLVILRYVFGWWPAKLCAILQLIGNLGYGMLTALSCGQILSAVSDGRMTVIVGVIIAAVIVFLVCIIGMKVFHIYERFVTTPLRMPATLYVWADRETRYTTGTPSSPRSLYTSFSLASRARTSTPLRSLSARPRSSAATASATSSWSSTPAFSGLSAPPTSSCTTLRRHRGRWWGH